MNCSMVFLRDWMSSKFQMICFINFGCMYCDCDICTQLHPILIHICLVYLIFNTFWPWLQHLIFTLWRWNVAKNLNWIELWCMILLRYLRKHARKCWSAWVTCGMNLYYICLIYINCPELTLSKHSLNFVLFPNLKFL